MYPIESLSTCSDHNHLSSLCDKLTSIELGNHGLQHLITDGGQHLKCEVVILNELKRAGLVTIANLFIKILTQLLVQGRQVAAVWSGENSERDVHHLQVLGAGGAGDLPGAGPDVVDYGVLEPGNPEVKSFGQGVVLDPTEPVEHDCPVTTINSVHGILQADVGTHSCGDQFSSKAEALWCFSHSSRQVVQFVSHDNSEVDSEKKISHH